MKKSVIISGIIIILLVISLGVWYFTQQPSYSNNPPVNNTSTGNPSDSTGVQTYNIEISGFAFNPSTLTIKVGDSVTWTNGDSATHTIISDSGTELGSQPTSSGGIYSHTFNTAGTYDYHCSIHTSMKGKVIVA